QRGWDAVEEALADLDETIQLEGPQTIAAFMLEPIVGTNGILIPPDGYLQGVRALCDRYGILMICDEVMSGFGRTGRWFAVDHWGVVPDMITMAKGLTSAYVQLGAVGLRRPLAKYFDEKLLYCGLTYNRHTLACAAAWAALRAMRHQAGSVDLSQDLNLGPFCALTPGTTDAWRVRNQGGSKCRAGVGSGSRSPVSCPPVRPRWPPARPRRPPRTMPLRPRP